jgi:hypothetical protein
MKGTILSVAAAAALAGVFAAAPALHASDPVGIYAIVEKVVLEPNEAEPMRIQVWGAFALADSTMNNDDYSTATAGYVYYSCQAGKEQTCRNEWKDLKSVAGTGTGVGFGGRFEPATRIRKASEAAASPDPYPIRMGVVKMSTRGQQPAIVARLKAALTATK